MNFSTKTPSGEEGLLERFVRYARVFTTSDEHSTSKPSTPGQWDLLNLLADEAQKLGAEVTISPHGYVIAKIAATQGCESAPVIAFLAHVDTSPDSPGQNVNPIIHYNFNGEDIHLPTGEVITIWENPRLMDFIGTTIVTSDGSTLLGADDKAGVAALMFVIEQILTDKTTQHGNLEFIFTSDEEVGRGTEDFPFDQIQAKFAYTLDGSIEGTYESECYNAYRTTAEFTGKSIHPGSARGVLINASNMASSFIGMLPRNESPEATDGRFGCLWVSEMKGQVENAVVEIRVRDFEIDQAHRRLRMLDSIAKAVEQCFPGGTVKLTHQLQYFNMRDKIDGYPKLIKHLETAIRSTGLRPWQNSIRGGTDGARLTELGLPTPNIFTGGMNYHSRSEWLAMRALLRATQTVIELIRLWAGERG